jgi:hypothetical protein
VTMVVDGLWFPLRLLCLLCRQGMDKIVKLVLKILELSCSSASLLDRIS